MKKSIKSVLAKSLAVAMAFSLAGIAPTSDAASKKPTLTKKVTVNVGKKKTVKVTSKKKVKKTTWSLKKGGSKIVSLSKKKAKSVVVKGKKKGSTTLTAKIKVGSKTYKKTCKITVKKAAIVTAKPTAKVTVATPTPANNNGGNNNGGNNATPTPKPTEKPVDKFKTDKGVLTVDEDASHNIPLTALNETTATSAEKRSSDSEAVTENTVFNRDGSVTYTSSKDYNSGVSFYINPCTSEDQLDASEDNEEIKTFANGVKDVSAYDYIRVRLTSEGEMNLRTYADTMQFTSAGFPGSSNTETYEGSWVLPTSGTEDTIFTDQTELSAGMGVKDEYKTRTVFIPLSMLISKGMDPEKLEAIAFSPQSTGVEVTIHRIDFVKVKYDKLVTGIEVSAAKTEIAPGKTTTVTATVTPADATRDAVKWTSSDDSIATVNFQGTVVASKNKTGEVTITATATDGSGVVGSTTIKVAEPQDEPTVISTHKVDLTKVVAKTNPNADVVAATQTAESIEFMAGGSMTFVDFSKYLADNNLDLADYKSLDVTWEVQDADGNKVTDYAGAVGTPTYGKIAYVAAANLNGYGDGIDVNYEGAEDTEVNKAWLSSPYTGETCTLTIAKTNPMELATVAGFNLQLEKLPPTMKIVITDITLVSE